ncbi:MAG: hypothetical protein PHF45_02305 [Candidatus Pacebacteria bacterium]|nr:hypothetical protein [Candidatus Paceibacterota bacterium]
MKRVLVMFCVFLVLGASFMPVFNCRSSETRINAPILLASIKLPSNHRILLDSCHSSEAIFQNNSFEFVAESTDVFSDVNGFRPYPWGGEIFLGEISFLCSRDNYMGRRSFMVQGKNKSDHGAIAVPDLFLKPNVDSEELYYVSFWVKYEVQEGEFRLVHQFFLPDDEKYPSYACYGPWIKGSSHGDWEYFGLIVQSPSGVWKGDPVLEFKGKGAVFADNAYFGKIKIIEEVINSENP